MPQGSVRDRTAAAELADAVATAESPWRVVHRYGAYVLLAVAVLLLAATSDVIGMSRTDWDVAGGLSALALVLQLAWTAAEPEPMRVSAVSAAFYWTRWAIAFVVTLINPFFAFFAAVGYYDADRLLPRWQQRPAILASVVIVAGSQSGGLWPDSPLAWAVFGALVVANMAFVVITGHLQEKEQERARVQVRTIRELAETNAALQAALDENAHLHSQLLVQAREAGVADERRRLAAEIHDTIAQGLTGIIAQIQVVKNAPTLEIAREHLDRADALARHSLGEARRSVHNLSPAALADAGLPEALKKTVADWGGRTGVRAEFTVTGTAQPLHDEIEATLLRITEEALSNAARHAHATRLGVTLSFMAGEVTLDVRDDGRGFDPLALPARTGSGGFGLDGMRARAERLTGDVTIESEPGSGTAISARVPLVPHDQ
ncbi:MULTISPECIES: sensor histidine kinase [unclassified Streptomyces]|uniref:sensor histidine kinase n=1 Tax=unclassified Streptomyces TaxID=2593676 RepID=UPI000DBA2D0E|nr:MULTISPECIES: sensor histidine kinase [unclassified Streptomyces]MYT69527.1 sensor histidine kinase [Streptomyces sp. SID8367]